jgi:hypothetical protein
MSHPLTPTVGAPGRGTSSVSTNFTSGSDGGPQGSIDPWGHFALRLPQLRLHRAGGVRRRAYFCPATPSRCPDGGSRTRDIRPRLLERDYHGHVGSNPRQDHFSLTAYYLTFQASRAKPLAWGEFMERYTAMYPRGQPDIPDDPVTAYVNNLRATDIATTTRRTPITWSRDPTCECNICVVSASSSSDPEPAPRHY